MSFRVSVLAVLTLLLVGGVTAAVTSVDSIQFDSNSKFFSGEVFVIQYISNFDTDRIDVVLSSNDLEQAADGEVDQDLSIDVVQQDTAALYSISPSGEPRLGNLELTTAEKSTFEELDRWAWDTCYDINGDGGKEYAYESVLTWSGTVYRGYCARENGFYGPVGRITKDREVFTTEWRVEASGESAQTATLSNGDTGRGVVSDIGDHVKVRWDGNLDTGEEAPPADKEYALHGNQFEDGWRIIDRGRYADWRQHVRDLDTAYEQWRDGDRSRDYLQNQLDTATEQAAAEYTGSPLTSAETVSSTYTDGQLRLEMDTDLAYPSFTVYVDGAEYVSVSKPVGRPEITSTNGDEFGELDTGYVTGTVRNVGDGEGSFAGRLTSCSDGFSFDSTQRTQRVDPGASVTYEFPVSFTSTGDQDEVGGSCTIEVTDTGSGERDFATAAVTGVQENECSPGERFSKVASGGQHVIYQCSEDGMTFTEVERCEQGEEARQIDSELQCVVPDGPDGPGLIDRLGAALGDLGESVDQAVLQPFRDINNMINVVVTFVAALLGFGLGRNELAAVADIQSERYRLVLGIIFAAVLGAFAYVFIASPVVKIAIVAALGLYMYVKVTTPL